MTKESKFILQMIRNGFSNSNDYDCTDLNWNIVIKQLNGHRIIPNAFELLKALMPLEYMPELLYHYDRVISEINYSLIQLEKFAEAAHKEKLRYVLIKGFGISQQIYDNLYARQFHDLDILVEEDDLIRADYILRQLDYKQPYFVDYDTRTYKELSYPITRMRQAQHLFPYFHMDKLPWQKVEVHKKIHFVQPDNIKDFLWNVEKVKIGSIDVNIPNIRYSFISLVLNTYEDSDTLFGLQLMGRIRGYIELYLFLKKYGNMIDWKEMETLLEKYHITSIANRVLDHICELYNDYSIQSYKFNQHTNPFTFWDLSMDFIEQMFDSELRKKQIRNLIKEKIFNLQNTKRKIYQQFNYSQMWTHNTIHPVDINYQLTYNAYGLQIYILLDSRIAAEIENYMFQLMIYNNIQDNNCLYTLFEVSYETEPVAYILNTPVRRDSGNLRNKYPRKKLSCSSELFENKLLIKSSVNYNQMSLEGDIDKCTFAIVFSWFKYMHPSTYCIMENDGKSLENTIILEFC